MLSALFYSFHLVQSICILFLICVVMDVDDVCFYLGLMAIAGEPDVTGPRARFHWLHWLLAFAALVSEPDMLRGKPLGNVTCHSLAQSSNINKMCTFDS